MHNKRAAAFLAYKEKKKKKKNKKGRRIKVPLYIFSAVISGHL